MKTKCNECGTELSNKQDSEVREEYTIEEREIALIDFMRN